MYCAIMAKTVTRYDQVKQIIHNFKLSYNARNGIKWGIELKDTKELIGTIGFTIGLLSINGPI